MVLFTIYYFLFYHQGVEIGELIAKYMKYQEVGTVREPQPVSSDYQTNAITNLWPSQQAPPGPSDPSMPAGQANGIEGRYRTPSSTDSQSSGAGGSSIMPASPSHTPPAGAVRVMSLPPLQVNVDQPVEYNNNYGPPKGMTDPISSRQLNGDGPGYGTRPNSMPIVESPRSSQLPLENGYPPAPMRQPMPKGGILRNRMSSSSDVVRNPMSQPQPADNILKRGNVRGARK